MSATQSKSCTLMKKENNQITVVCVMPCFPRSACLSLRCTGWLTSRGTAVTCLRMYCFEAKLVAIPPGRDGALNMAESFNCAKALSRWDFETAEMTYLSSSRFGLRGLFSRVFQASTVNSADPTVTFETASFFRHTAVNHVVVVPQGYWRPRQATAALAPLLREHRRLDFRVGLLRRRAHGRSEGRDVSCSEGSQHG